MNKKLIANRSDFFEVMFYVLCFFPYYKFLGIGLNSTDLQPFCLLYSLILLLGLGVTKKIILPKKIFLLYAYIVGMVIIGVIILLFREDVRLSFMVREIVMYSSLICISMLAFLFMKDRRGINEKCVKILLNVYFIIGAIQTFIYKDFFGNLMSSVSARTTNNRGVYGIAGEPSFYGYMLIFLLLLVFEFQNKKDRIFYGINILIQIVVFAQSAITMLYLSIFIFLWELFSINKMSIKKIIAVILSICLGSGILYYLLQHGDRGKRFLYLFQLGVKNFKYGWKYVIAMDESVSIRYYQIIDSVNGCFQHYFLPSGCPDEKIQSGYGAVIYSYGILGILFVLFLYRLIQSAYLGKKRLVIPLFISIIMFSSIQIANPIIGLYIGWCMYKSSEIAILGKLE